MSPPWDKHILCWPHPPPSAPGTIVHCVSKTGPARARTMRLHSPSRQALLISFPFYSLLCVRVHEMKCFLLFETRQFEG